MVEKEKDLFVCGECGFKYNEEKFAKKCEDYCKKNKSCSLEITKHAVKK